MRLKRTLSLSQNCSPSFTAEEANVNLVKQVDKWYNVG